MCPCKRGKSNLIHRCALRRLKFKAHLVAACQQPGTSIAALAGSQGMNANVLYLDLDLTRLHGHI